MNFSQKIIGFSEEEFNNLFEICQTSLGRIRKGRQIKTPIKERFYILLVWLRKYHSYEELGISYNLTKRKVFNLINIALEDCYEPLIQHFIKWYSKDQLEENNIMFSNFPNALAVVDATVQPIERPLRNQKDWFSGKHGCHVIKSQTINSPDGRVMHVYCGKIGKDHDITLWRESNMIEQFQIHPIMGDKGYVGIQHDCRAILPVKRQETDPSVKKKNSDQKVSKDRIIIENYYGQLKVKFKILSFRYRGLLKNI
ncbi:hypothetical protein M0812_27844 [Anaeramoeba flamelloides]|uniref:DDE Tnp4 domain-containing protein n=1 Tax=Anaeramoeba flamelloides TaxID=1746091 RepID=A0AAV7Y9W2_9EUKA|nr:hypothetical protein M0812_27844 [Anaeramoeba flamelloides]